MNNMVHHDLNKSKKVPHLYNIQFDCLVALGSVRTIPYKFIVTTAACPSCNFLIHIFISGTQYASARGASHE